MYINFNWLVSASEFQAGLHLSSWTLFSWRYANGMHCNMLLRKINIHVRFVSDYLLSLCHCFKAAKTLKSEIQTTFRLSSEQE